MASNHRLNRTSTLQHASNVFVNVLDPQLRERYGTSVDEFMSKEHQAQIQKRIRELRKKFQEINKDKNSFISVEELTNYFNQTKRNVYNLYTILINLLYRKKYLTHKNILKEYSKC